MNLSKLICSGLTALTLSVASLGAHAEVQTWRFTGAIDYVAGSFFQPKWLSVSQPLIVDFDIEMSTPLVGDFYSDPLRAISFNGHKISLGVDSRSEITSLSWFFALDVDLSLSQLGDVSRVSWVAGRPAIASAVDLSSLLSEISNGDISLGDYMYIDVIGSPPQSIGVRPLSLVALSVPEVETMSMAAMGVLLLASLGKRLRMTR